MMFSASYKEKYARLLMRLAWAIEGIAVLIGLTISVVVSYSANKSIVGEGNEVAGISSMLVAGLPFLMVAVVELCKIPLSFAFMAVKNFIWRTIFFVCVLFLCSITFETMLNGFERNFSNLNYRIDQRKNSIENLGLEIELLQDKRERVQRFTSEDLDSEQESRQSVIDSEYQASVDSMDEKTQSLLSQIDYSFRQKIQQDIDELLAIRENYYTEWNKEREAVEERFSALLLDNLSDSRGEKDRLLAELEELKTEMAEQLDNTTFLSRSVVEARYRELIAAKNAQIDQITLSYLGGDALSKQAEMEEQMKEQLAFVQEKYEERIADVNARIDAKKEESRSKEAFNTKLRQEVAENERQGRAQLLAFKSGQEGELSDYSDKREQELNAIMEEVEGINDQVFRLQNEQRTLQAEINMLINQNQVYRLAMYAYGQESATDVTRKMVGVVAFFWFGSLALIASITGVILSVAGFYLKRVLEESVDVGRDHATGGKKNARPATTNGGAVAAPARTTARRPTRASGPISAKTAQRTDVPVGNVKPVRNMRPVGRRRTAVSPADGKHPAGVRRSPAGVGQPEPEKRRVTPDAEISRPARDGKE